MPPYLPFTLQAIAVLKGPSTVTGTITFTQTSANSVTTITGNLAGLDVNAQRGLHVQCVHSLYQLTIPDIFLVRSATKPTAVPQPEFTSILPTLLMGHPLLVSIISET
jgi:hypothetical protein